MATNLLLLFSQSSLFSQHHLLQNPSTRSRTCSPYKTQQQLSSASLPTPPPSSRQEAILQARTCLSTALQKHLHNPLPLPTKKLKKRRQPRYRLEIPILDDSPDSLVELALDVFEDLPITRKGNKPCILILWPDKALVASALQVFSSGLNLDFSTITAESLNTADLAVFATPDGTKLEDMRKVANAMDPKPLVLFNPAWGFEEEKDFVGGGFSSFIGSFDVVYSFMGLEVKGILSKRKGVVFRCVKDGVVSGEGWVVMVEEEEEEKGKLKVVSRFKRRPSIGEVENVLYNLMAANSPITKSVKFFRDLASNLRRKTEEQ